MGTNSSYKKLGGKCGRWMVKIKVFVTLVSKNLGDTCPPSFYASYFYGLPLSQGMVCDLRNFSAGGMLKRGWLSKLRGNTRISSKEAINIFETLFVATDPYISKTIKGRVVVRLSHQKLTILVFEFRFVWFNTRLSVLGPAARVSTWEPHWAPSK